MPPAARPRHRLALAALLLRHADHARAPAACPPPAALASLCGAARAVSSGNCAVCVADKVARGHPPAACSNGQIDAFCSGAALAPPPRPPPAAGSGLLGPERGLGGGTALPPEFAALLGQASPGDMLVRGASSWQIPAHRTIINAIDEFQVDPTGATNSSDRMQAAVDAAGRLPNGGSVYLPAGNYQIENIAVPSNVDVFGDSRSRTFCHTPSASKPMFVVMNSMNVRIRDLWLVGSQTKVMTSGALLYAKNAQKCQFTNLQLTNFYVGIRAESSTNCEISFINSYNCYGPAVLQITGVNMNGGGCYVFKNQFDMAPYGFPAPGLSAGYGPWAPLTRYQLGDVRSHGGYFFLCVGAGTSGRSSGPAIAPFSDAGGQPHQIDDGSARWAFMCSTTMVKIDISQANSNMVFANDLDGIAFAAIRVENSQFNIINSNFLTGNCAHGIVMGENAADNTFALNHVINNPGFGVFEASAVGSARNSYTDNKFDNTGSAAASLQQPWSTFSGNTIRAANILDAGAAISVAAGTSHVSVEHNKVSSDRSTVGVKIAAGSSDRCKIIGNGVGHLPTGVDTVGVTGSHNDIAYNS